MPAFIKFVALSLIQSTNPSSYINPGRVVAFMFSRCVWMALFRSAFDGEDGLVEFELRMIAAEKSISMIFDIFIRVPLILLDDCEEMVKKSAITNDNSF